MRKREAYGGEHSRGEENRAKRNGGEILGERDKFPDTECSVEPSYLEVGKQGSVLQREYA